MKSKFVAVLILLSLLTSTLAIAIHVVPAKAANEHVRVYIDPPLVSKVPGDVDSFFDVFVTIEDVTDLFGFDIRVSWNNTLLTLNSTVEDTYFDTIWGANHWQRVFNETYSGGGGGGGGYKLVALSTLNSFTKDPGAQVLFSMHFKMIKSCNFILETPFYFDLVKLSDKNYTPIQHTTTNGQYHMDKTIPDLEFVLIDPTPSKLFEYCKTFEVEVYATHICAQMTDYDLTILYDNELLKFIDVDYWGVFGTGQSDGTTLGSVHVWMTPPGTPHTGDSILLFALTFHIEYNDDINHIWRVNAPHDLHAQISVKNDVGEFSFLEGTIPITGIILPAPQDVTVHLIKGDVDCNGYVDVFDLRCIAAFYDQSSPVKYDLTMDNTIDIFDLVVIATNFGYNAP
jgi:hypothetical protein